MPEQTAAAITVVDAYLYEAGLPTYTDLVVAAVKFNGALVRHVAVDKLTARQRKACCDFYGLLERATKG